MRIHFYSPKEFVNWLLDHEGEILADGYGRQWKYENFKFWFKDIMEGEILKEGLKCLHLYGTEIYHVTEKRLWN